MVETIEEVDEDDENYDSEMEPSGCVCVCCDNELRLTEEVFLLRVVHPFVVDGHAEYHDIFDANGQYTYEPVFFDFECWEDEEEEVKTIQEDVPPSQHPDGIILCDFCESDILQGELMGHLCFGEIRWSDRTPNNRHTPVFVELSAPQHLCIGCLTHLEDNRTSAIWSNEFEPVPGLAVCVEGVFERCWRDGNCNCPKRICEAR